MKYIIVVIFKSHKSKIVEDFTEIKRNMADVFSQGEVKIELILSSEFLKMEENHPAGQT